LQTTPDGRFSIEFVECLASCGTAPVILCNDRFYEGVTPAKVDELLERGDT
jgi:NADH-quinone oxidoreductase subunit E